MSAPTPAQPAPGLAHLPVLRVWFEAGAPQVAGDYRCAGIEPALLRALETLAENSGCSAIYCAASTARDLLERDGWRFMEGIEHAGGSVCVYRKPLPGREPAGAPRARRGYREGWPGPAPRR
jgi:hypothetical protein